MSVVGFAKLLSDAPPKKTGKWWMIPCPLAEWRHQSGKDSTPSFGVKHDGFTHCFGCDWKGSAVELCYQLKYHGAELPYRQLLDEASDLEFELQVLEEPTEEQVFPEHWLKSFPSVFKVPEAIGYVQGRKGGPYDVTQIERFDLRYDPVEKRVCFPIRDRTGLLKGLHGRAIDDDAALKYRMYDYQKRVNPMAWLGEHWVDPSQPVVIGESVFDALRLAAVAENVMSPLTASMSEPKMDRLGDLFEIITVFDADKAGRIAQKKITKYLGRKRRIRHVELSPEDDASATPVSKLAKLIEPLMLDSGMSFD